MLCNRVDRYMQAKHPKIYEPTFLESPFAEVDFRGNGIRQVYLALTRANFIICNERLPPAEQSLKKCKKKIDPLADCLELDNVVPYLHCEFHICKRFDRNFLHVILNRDAETKMYFEFGHHFHRSFYFMCWSDCIVSMPEIKEMLYSKIGKDTVDFENEKEDKFQENWENPTNLFEKTREEVQNLKRRVNRLKKNIKKHVKISDESESEEKMHLLAGCERKYSGDKIDVEAMRHKPLIDLYKKSPRQSDNSVDNIWF